MPDRKLLKTKALKPKRPKPNRTLRSQYSQQHNKALLRDPTTIDFSDILYYWANNPCSLNKDKHNELVARLANIRDPSLLPHDIWFTETWFTNDSDTSIAGYQLHRKDRIDRGGGVAIYIKDSVVAEETNVVELNSPEIEQIWQMIKIGEDVILIGCIYRPRDFNDDYFVSVLATILAAKNVLQKLGCSSMLLYGDFNLKETSYKSIEEGSAVATIAYVAHKHPTDLKFQECLNECHLTQLVIFPTYRQYRDARFSSTLDLIISDKPDRSIEITRADHLGDTPGGQAHCMIHGLFALTGHNTTTTPMKKRFIWSKADYNSISTCISSIDWITTFNGSSVHENYKILVKNYNDAVNKFIPTTTSPFYKNQPLWITPEVLKTIKKKEKLWGKYIAAGRETHEALRVKHKLACKIVKKTINKAVTDHEEKLVKDSKSHPKNVHAYVRSKQEVKDPLHSIETDNGIITTDKNIICSILNNYF
ncbi:uncharacterized protein LOC101235138 [Hydra vulgaris]|uniref:uncharacterized protein LOC101235138 n=1 Tax=Hydra vulgaris TaxID=6087 RepID=UPI0002B49111|nr:uncharacterized protein LOC101235138 [Hydra vulgaris]